MAATTLIVFLILLLFLVDFLSRKCTVWFFGDGSKTVSTEPCVERESQIFFNSVVTLVIFLLFYIFGYRSISYQFPEGFWSRITFLAGIYLFSSCIGSRVDLRTKKQNMKITVYGFVLFLFLIFLTFNFLNGLTLVYGRHLLWALIDEFISPTH